MPKSSNEEELFFGRSGREGDNTVRSGGSSRKPVLVLRSRHFVAAAHLFCVSFSTWFTARRKKWPGSGAHAALEGDRSVPDRGRSRELKLRRRDPDAIARQIKDRCLALLKNDDLGARGIGGGHGILVGAGGSRGEPARSCADSSAVVLTGGNHGEPARVRACSGVAARIGERHDGFVHPDGRHVEPTCARSGSGVVPCAGKGQDGLVCACVSHAELARVLAVVRDALVHAGKQHGEPTFTLSVPGFVDTLI